MVPLAHSRGMIGTALSENLVLCGLCALVALATALTLLSTLA